MIILMLIQIINNSSNFNLRFHSSIKLIKELKGQLIDISIMEAHNNQKNNIWTIINKNSHNNNSKENQMIIINAASRIIQMSRIANMTE